MIGLSMQAEIVQQTQFQEYTEKNIDQLPIKSNQNIKKIYQLVRQFEEVLELPKYSCRFGRWLIAGSPLTLLLPVDLRSNKINKAFEKSIDCLNVTLSLDCNKQFDSKEQFKRNSINLATFSWLFITYLQELLIAPNNMHLIVQTHEWLSVGAIILMKHHNAAQLLNLTQKASEKTISTIFTTHATTAGRHLSASGNDLEAVLSNPPDAAWIDHFAVEHGIEYEHRIERAGAAHCNIFTCVSQQTAKECQVLLGRQIDVITYNGLDIMKIRGIQGLYQCKQIQEKLKAFLSIYFYGLDLSQTSIFFTAGRYEFVNKGFDIFIDSMNRLRQMLEQEHSTKQAIGIIIAPDSHRGLTEHSLQIQNLQQTISIKTQQISIKAQEKMQKLVTSQNPQFESLPLNKVLSRNDITTLQLLHQQVKYTGSYSPICTHNIVNENTQILQRLRQHDLINQPLSKVKMIFIPEFLQQNSIFSMDYQDFVKGCDMGVFCSQYEPFGYTPVECAAVGCASITSNRCGVSQLTVENEKMLTVETPVEKMNRILSENSLGRSRSVDGGFQNSKIAHMRSQNQWENNKLGIQIIDRIYKNYNESVEQMAQIMKDYMDLDDGEKSILKQKMYTNSVVFDWNSQFDKYLDAYFMAWDKVGFVDM